MTINLVEWGFFGVLTILTIGGGIATVTSRNLFHAAHWLILTLFGVAGFFVMLAAPFLAVVQVMVYIGAIVILIIFAIMLTRRLMGIKEAANNQWPLGLAAAGLTFAVIAGALWLGTTGTSPLIPRVPVLQNISPDSLRDLGVALVSSEQYVLPFLLASVLLEGAMVGAIVIARDQE
jgi:NADH-quinone oxidoreductase subunit J